MEEKIQFELSLLKEYLERYNIKTAIYTAKSLSANQEFSESIFSFFFKKESFERYVAHILTTYDRNTLYLLTSDVFCEYYLFFIPDTEVTFITIGPFTTKTITETSIKKKMEYHKVPNEKYEGLLNYYGTIKYVPDPSTIHTLVAFFYSHVQKNKKYDFKELNMESFDDNYKKPERTDEDNPIFNMNLLSQRYELENSLLSAVAKGDLHNAEILFSRFVSSVTPQNRAENPIRNKKNYTIILNTLLRKAVEKGKVHPLHIDELSSKIAYRIEKCKTMEELSMLGQEMVRKYCLLVREHTIDEQHSILIKQTITLINYDYTANLNLNEIAKKLNVNASYLSTLFKQETNETLTEYVTRKRMEYATLLLNNSDLSISEVAAFCGINDLQYFSKTFKKVVGHTPSEYKKLVRLTPTM